MTAIGVRMPPNSGVTVREANEEVLNLILQRVTDIAKRIDLTAIGLRELATRVATPSLLTDEQLAQEVRNLEEQLQLLITLRTSLDFRLTAFSNQRRVALTPEANDPFADPTPVLKAS